MSLSDRRLTLAAFMKLELPGGDVRLCDGGVLKFGGEEYAARHPIWGALAEVPPAESALGDFAPGGSIVLAVDPSAPRSTLLADAVRQSRVRAWWGEVDSASNTVTSATLLGDWVVDFPRLRVTRAGRLVSLQMITRAERLFLTNRGNVCSPRFHKSIWPGERGFDNCTDVPVQVAWGTQGAPAGSVGAGMMTGGSPGSIAGGRQFVGRELVP